MPDVIFVATGQCGNQLCLELLSYLRLHALDKRFAAQNAGADSREKLIEMFFSTPTHAFDDGLDGSNLTARAVCLDTEPKVIDECLRQSQRQGHWMYDAKSVAYRHGGAGNNWALGYAMASDSFLETSINCIRRQVERSDNGATLAFLQSLAGGTGSGLGTRITEACRDEFADLTRFNIAIAPHHFGEVVVQYYNALLSIAKVSRASHGVLIFENEIAQQLCREMHGIDKPLLKDLNHVIASNLIPALLPKVSGGSFTDISHDLRHLCALPSYRFINVKLTPQTSRKSIDFTFDSWATLLKTIQRLQLSGTPSERHIRRGLQHAGSSPQSATKDPSSERAGGRPLGGSPLGELPQGQTAMVRAVASSVTCHGNEASDVVREFLQCAQDSNVGISPSLGGTDIARSAPAPTTFATPTKVSRSRHQAPGGPGCKMAPSILENTLLGDFLPSHSALLPSLGSAAVTMNSSSFALNRYQRSSSITSNDQTILPMLQRPWQRGKELYDMRAYLHQYQAHGLEMDDFVSAFRSVSTAIHDYASL